jgi:DNA-binding GntR family transcriptional regulator
VSNAADTSRLGLPDRVYEQLKEMLVEGRVEPGSRLVIDRLAEDLGVSHTPLREAFARLEADRLVVKTANKGYTAAPLLDASRLLQLWEARLILEPAATELAVARGGEDLERRVTATQERLERAPTGRAYREYRQFAEADAAFHETIAELSGNEYVREMIERLRAHQQSARLWARSGVPGIGEAIAEHRAVLDQILARDAYAAGEAMRTHLQQSRARVFALIDPSFPRPREPV